MIELNKTQRLNIRSGLSRGFGVACLFAGAALVSSCGSEPPPKPPKAVVAYVVTDPTGLSENSFPGLAAAANEANMSFRVAGPLVELPVSVGDSVKAGTVIAKIDPNDFEVRLDNVKAILEGAEAANRRSEADYNRLKSAQDEDSGATSQRAVDFALANRDETRAAVSSARATVQTATDRLSYTELLAPFDGKVVETYVENFETVVPLQPILRLVDSRSIQMTLAIPENLIGYVGSVTDIVVSFDALPGVEYPAEIAEISSEASQVSRTYPVTLELRQQPGSEVLPGMAGHATVRAERSEDNAPLHIPASALFSGPEAKTSFVWLIENETILSREVEVGALTDAGILITAGLNPGDVIVRAGVSQLSEGQTIRAVEAGEVQ